MKWIYLSPHYDDAVFSCGGLIYQQVQQGIEVEIWTVFGGPGVMTDKAKPFLEKWGVRTPGEAIAMRQQEDRDACRVLGCGYRHFGYPEEIFRGDMPFICFNSGIGDVVVAPIGISHKDHLLVSVGAAQYRYAEIPYIWTHAEEAGAKISHFAGVEYPLSHDSNRAWVEAANCYRSQVYLIQGREFPKRFYLYE